MFPSRPIFYFITVTLLSNSWQEFFSIFSFGWTDSCFNGLFRLCFLFGIAQVLKNVQQMKIFLIWKPANNRSYLKKLFFKRMLLVQLCRMFSTTVVCSMRGLLYFWDCWVFELVGSRRAEAFGKTRTTINVKSHKECELKIYSFLGFNVMHGKLVLFQVVHCSKKERKCMIRVVYCLNIFESKGG